MSRVHVIFAGATTPWLSIANDAVVQRGDDYADLIVENDDRSVLIVPAASVVLHICDLPGLTPAQAQAAARHRLADKSLLPPDSLFAACGGQGAGDPPRLVALAAVKDIADWIAAFDPDVILPSPLLLPEPGDGFVRAALPHETVLRGTGTGFAEDLVISPLLVGDADVETLDRARLEAAMIGAAARPPVNLRQGLFAKRRRWSPDRAWLRRMTVLTLAIAGVTIAIPIVQIARLNAQSAALEETSASLAQAALGGSVASETARSLLDTRLSALRGGGAGFSQTSKAVMRAIEASANVELTQMDFAPDGMMRLAVRGLAPADITAFGTKLQASGFAVTIGPLNPSQTQPVATIQVRGR